MKPYNLLGIALKNIGIEELGYQAMDTAAVDQYGEYQITYADAITIEASFQPVPRNLYQQSGLDFQKNYANIFTSHPITDVRPGQSGDRIIYDNKTWDVISKVPWNAVNGWNQCLVVEVSE